MITVEANEPFVCGTPSGSSTYSPCDFERYNLCRHWQSSRYIQASQRGEYLFLHYGIEDVRLTLISQIARIVGEAEFAIVQLVVFGSHILGLCDDNVLRMWDYKTQELYTQVEFDETFTASAILHPSTYLNKVLVSSNQGTMQIWNMRTNQMIYSFKSFGSPITSLTQSPVVDVVAIGLLDGTTILHNIKMDEKIDNVRQDERVTAVSFRTGKKNLCRKRAHTSAMFNIIA